jgi:hypothetical protein
MGRCIFSQINAKKMILSQLISEIKVSRNYHIEIQFRISAQQLGQELGYDPPNKSRRKTKDDPAR